jgi:predicted nucleic acid-binding protein
MKPLRVYIDTSVVGGCLDPGFQEGSVDLFSRLRTGEMTAVVSDLMHYELESAPAAVRAVLKFVPVECREEVVITREAARLAERYIQAGVVGRTQLSDAQHIATATVHRVDVVASWDFKHMVNEARVRGYNAVNLREGYALLSIRTPAEVVRHAQ